MKRIRLILALFGIFYIGHARAVEGPLMINGRVVSGVMVTSQGENQWVSRDALEKTFGPLDHLLPSAQNEVPLSELKTALGATTKKPAWAEPSEPTPRNYQRVLLRAGSNLDDSASPEQVLRAMDRAMMDARLEASEDKPLAPGAVAWWLRRTEIMAQRGSKEGDRARMVLQAREQQVFRITLSKLDAHRVRLHCLFCDAVVPLATPDVTGLVQANYKDTGVGIEMIFLFRPEEMPQIEFLEEPSRLLVSWPLNYLSKTEKKINSCLKVDTILSGDLKGPLTYHHVVFDLDCKTHKLAVLRSADRLAKVRDPLGIAQHQSPLLLINGGYFDGGGNTIGLWRKNGKLLSTGSLNRTALVVGKEGEISFDKPQAKIKFSYRCGEEIRSFPINRVNLAPRPDAYSLYTEPIANAQGNRVLKIPKGEGGYLVMGNAANWGKSLCDGVQVPAPFAPPISSSPEIPPEENGDEPQGEVGEEEGGGEVVVESPPEIEMITPDPVPEMAEISYVPDGMEEAPEMLEAGPRLVREGEAKSEAPYENFQTTTGHFGPEPAPRTAMGIDTHSNRLHLIYVSGRHRESRGLTLQETAELLRDLGAVEAMNFDGGGSSVMIVEGRPLSRSPLLETLDPRRAIPNAIAIVAKDFEEKPFGDAGLDEPYLDPNIPPLPEIPAGLFDGAGGGTLPNFGDGLKPAEDPVWRNP